MRGRSPKLANQEPEKRDKRRVASVYDAVAGRVGPNGFLTREQLQSSSLIPRGPDEMLRRSFDAPEQVFDNLYNADEQLLPHQQLPDSDLVKAVHCYASDFYGMATVNKGLHDFKSFDETALLAFGVLLEEAAHELLGETGDMALVEPEGLQHGLPESKMTKHQILGRVKRPPTPVMESAGSDMEEDRLKRQKLAGTTALP